MQEGTWQNVLLGADAPSGMQARGTLVTADKHGRATPTGPFLHAFLKFRLPGDPKVYMITARVSLRELEAAVRSELAQRSPGTAAQLETSAVSGGKIARKIRTGLKKAVKKIAKSKLVKGIVMVAKKIAKNPLIKGIISATPFGAAITATAAAARVAAKAIKGGIKAKKALKSIANRAKAGQPDAIKAARLVKKGMELTGITPQVSVTATAGGEGRYLGAVLDSCVNCAPANVHVPYVAGCGADYGDATPDELDALETIATAGAFEGLRWIARRLAPQSMYAPGATFGKRDALALGLSVMSQPRH